MDATHKYDDLLTLSPPRSRKHPPMPLHERAAQFSPFAALTGFDEAIDRIRTPSDDILPDTEAENSVFCPFEMQSEDLI